MDTEQIEQNIGKEKELLNKLIEKQEKINAKIKDKEQLIESMTHLLNSRKFDETENVLNASGLSISDILAAVKHGDLNLTFIQKKLGGDAADKDEDAVDHGVCDTEV